MRSPLTQESWIRNDLHWVKIFGAGQKSIDLIPENPELNAYQLIDPCNGEIHAFIPASIHISTQRG